MAVKDKNIPEKEDQAAPYDEFALIYDLFMEHVPYEAWARYLLSAAGEHFGRIPVRVCDLACGTGKMLFYLRPHVQKITGVDISPAMLLKAHELLGRDVPLFQAKLQGPLPYRASSFDWIVCMHDSLNYLIEKNDLKAHFAEVSRLLRTGGLYSTDIVSLYNIVHFFDGKTEVHRIRGKKIKWSNEYSKKNKILVSRLDFIESGRKKSEFHYQRYYTEKEVIEAAGHAGLTFLHSHADYTEKNPGKRDVLINLHFTKSKTASVRTEG